MLSRLEVFVTTKKRERVAIAREAARLLGPTFSPSAELVGRLGLPSLEHREHGTFVIVPGGAFEMGLSDLDLEALSEQVDWTSVVARTIARRKPRLGPIRSVAVAPFLCATRLLARDQIRTLLGGRHRNEAFHRAVAVSFVSDLGFRLPSEAELEWMARDGSNAAFVSDGAREWARSGTWPTVGSLGVESLSEGEWAADDWHPSYRGAPLDARAWMGGKPEGVRRGSLATGPEQDRAELLFGLSALRERGSGFYRIRLACDLPLARASGE